MHFLIQVIIECLVFSALRIPKKYLRQFAACPRPREICNSHTSLIRAYRKHIEHISLCGLVWCDDDNIITALHHIFSTVDCRLFCVFRIYIWLLRHVCVCGIFCGYASQNPESTATNHARAKTTQTNIYTEKNYKLSFSKAFIKIIRT